MQWTLKNWNKSLTIFTVLVLAIIIFVSLRDWSQGSEFRDGVLHSKFNNYLIFSNSFDVLKNGGDLYTYHAEEHYDLYKYSPAFAFFMAPLYYMPGWLGLTIWNLLNFLPLILGLKLLPKLTDKEVLIILLIGVLELVGSIMNEQSNGLMVGLTVLSLALLERGKYFWAIALLVASVYIKLFSGIFLSVLLFYPGIWRNALYTLTWFVFFTFIPIILTGWDQLVFLYQSWGFLLLNDHSTSQGYSLMGILYTWFGLEVNKFYLLAAGLLLTLSPLVKFSSYNSWPFRAAFLSSLLIWVIVFNHKSESPTFIIAMTGIGLYYVISPPSKWKNVLLVFALLFVSIGFSDLTPKFIREEFFHRYSLKALPCLVFWLVMVYDLLTDHARSLNTET